MCPRSLAACASFEQDVKVAVVVGERWCQRGAWMPKRDQFTRSFYLTLLRAQESPQVWYVSVC